MKKLSLIDLQKIELEMLEWLNDVCIKNDIHCCLSGGTLLGAIRHNGFIPWDDDIDVMIPRAEYNKLISILKKNNYPNYSICVINDKYPFPFAKLYNNSTRMESQYSTIGIDNRIWIDIFPVDGLPDNEIICKIKYSFIHFFTAVLMLCYSNPLTGKSEIRRRIKNIIAFPVKLIKASNWGKLIDFESKKKPFINSKYVGVQCWGYGFKERMPGNEWRNYQKKTFEGKDYYVPGCWDYYLKSLYGDYMKLPPIEKRKSHKVTAYLLEENDKEV